MRSDEDERLQREEQERMNAIRERARHGRQASMMMLWGKGGTIVGTHRPPGAAHTPAPTSNDDDSIASTLNSNSGSSGGGGGGGGWAALKRMLETKKVHSLPRSGSTHSNLTLNNSGSSSSGNNGTDMVSLAQLVLLKQRHETELQRLLQLAQRGELTTSAIHDLQADFAVWYAKELAAKHQRDYYNTISSSINSSVTSSPMVLSPNPSETRAASDSADHYNNNNNSDITAAATGTMWQMITAESEKQADIDRRGKGISNNGIASTSTGISTGTGVAGIGGGVRYGIAGTAGVGGARQSGRRPSLTGSTGETGSLTELRRSNSGLRDASNNILATPTAVVGGGSGILGNEFDNDRPFITGGSIGAGGKMNVTLHFPDGLRPIHDELARRKAEIRDKIARIEALQQGHRHQQIEDDEKIRRQAAVADITPHMNRDATRVLSRSIGLQIGNSRLLDLPSPLPSSAASHHTPVSLLHSRSSSSSQLHGALMRHGQHSPPSVTRASSRQSLLTPTASILVGGSTLIPSSTQMPSPPIRHSRSLSLHQLNRGSSRTVTLLDPRNVTTTPTIGRARSPSISSTSDSDSDDHDTSPLMGSSRQLMSGASSSSLSTMSSIMIGGSHGRRASNAQQWADERMRQFERVLMDSHLMDTPIAPASTFTPPHVPISNVTHDSSSSPSSMTTPTITTPPPLLNTDQVPISSSIENTTASSILSGTGQAQSSLSSSRSRPSHHRTGSIAKLHQLHEQKHHSQHGMAALPLMSTASEPSITTPTPIATASDVSRSASSKDINVSITSTSRPTPGPLVSTMVYTRNQSQTRLNVSERPLSPMLTPTTSANVSSQQSEVHEASGRSSTIPISSPSLSLSSSLITRALVDHDAPSQWDSGHDIPLSIAGASHRSSHVSHSSPVPTSVPVSMGGVATAPSSARYFIDSSRSNPRLHRQHHRHVNGSDHLRDDIAYSGTPRSATSSGGGRALSSSSIRTRPGSAIGNMRSFDQLAAVPTRYNPSDAARHAFMSTIPPPLPLPLPYDTTSALLNMRSVGGSVTMTHRQLPTSTMAVFGQAAAAAPSSSSVSSSQPSYDDRRREAMWAAVIGDRRVNVANQRAHLRARAAATAVATNNNNTGGSSYTAEPQPSFSGRRGKRVRTSIPLQHHTHSRSHGASPTIVTAGLVQEIMLT
jgi:hypothetical protein